MKVLKKAEIFFLPHCISGRTANLTNNLQTTIYDIRRKKPIIK